MIALELSFKYYCSPTSYIMRGQIYASQVRVSVLKKKVWYMSLQVSV